MKESISTTMSAAPARILVFRGGAIGDLVLTIPALLALREAFPSATLNLIGYPERAALASGSAKARVIGSLDEAAFGPLFVREGTLPPSLVRRLAGYDLALTYFIDDVAARNLRRLGIGRVLTGAPRPPEGAKVHAADFFLQPLAPLGIRSAPPPDRRPSPWVLPDPADEDAARAWLSARGLASGRPAPLVVHPGSGSLAKCWPSERFATVLGALGDETGAPVVVLGGPADGSKPEAVADHLRSSKTIVAKDLALGVVAAILRIARLYLGNDSGISHLAAAVGAPTVALFGPTDPRVWAPRGQHVAVVQSRGRGSGATIPGELDPSLLTISPERVLTVARRQLAESGPTSVA